MRELGKLGGGSSEGEITHSGTCSSFIQNSRYVCFQSLVSSTDISDNPYVTSPYDSSVTSVPRVRPLFPDVTSVPRV